MSAEKLRLAIAPATLRAALERLGPTYVKVGQFLALRPDLLPQEYCDELLRLVDSAPFFPFATAHRILCEDLGRDPERAFAELDPHPVAAASLSQVYQARTHDGEVVAVKVQREGMAAAVRRDLAQARLAQPLVELFRPLPGIAFTDVLAEVERWMLLELDFELERRNLERLGVLLAGDRRCRIPRVVPELCGRRVITMEYLVGIGFGEVLRLAGQGRRERLAELDLDREVLAENLLRCCLEQTFRHEVFHADMHPGNLIALPGDVVGFVDFGLTETLEPHLRAGVRRFVAAVYRDDPDAMVRAIEQMAVVTEKTQLETFRTALIAEHRLWQRRRPGGAAADTAADTAAGSPVRSYMIGVMRAARATGLRLPPSLLSLYRSVLTAETVARQLAPDADLMNVGRTFFLGLRAERLLDRLRSRELERTLIPYLELLEEPPEKYLGLAADLADGRYVLKVESAESPASRRSADRRARLVTLAIVLVALSVLWGSARDVVVLGRLPLAPVLTLAWAAVLGWLALTWRRL